MAGYKKLFDVSKDLRRDEQYTCLAIGVHTRGLDMLAAALLAAPFAQGSVTKPGRQLADVALSGGPGGRGWGGAAAEECSLGITTHHPTKAGFRVTMRAWARGATVRWQFDEAIELLKHWGPVRVLPLKEGSEGVIQFMLLGKHLPWRNHSHSRRTDQWGFVLKQPYTGRWRATCALSPGHRKRAQHQASMIDVNGTDVTALMDTKLPEPPSSRVGGWLHTLGLGKLMSAATSIGLLSPSAVAKVETAAAHAESLVASASDELSDFTARNLRGGSGRGGGKRGGRSRKARARRRRRRESKGERE